MSGITSKIMNSPVGKLAVLATEKGVNSIHFLKEKEQSIAEDHEGNTYIDTCCKQLEQYFAGNLKKFDVNLDLQGTDYQKRVWQKMLDIPYGETKSYGQISKELGYENGARAVGRAANTNPVPLIIPCHRVVGATGKLTGFASGIDVKLTLLNLEAGGEYWSLDGKKK